MRFPRWLIAIVAASFLATGCQEKSVLMGGKPRPKMYTSAVSLSPSVTEVLRTRAFKVRLLAATDRCNWPQLDPGVKIAVKGLKPNYELIASLSPSIVVYDDSLFSGQDVAKFKELGIETFAWEGDSVKDYVRCLYRFAARVGAETTVSDYIALVESAATNAAAVPLDPKPKVAILLAGSGTEHMIAGTRSFQADVARLCGGEVVGPDATNFVPVNAEALVSMNPDTVLVAGDATTAESILADPRLETIAAIRKKRVAGINPDVLLRRGGRVDQLLKQMATYLAVVSASVGEGP